MGSLLIITNLLLVTLTGAYAWLTMRNLKQLQQEGDYYRGVLERQLRVTTLPHLYWDLRVAEADSGLVLDVFNISGIPAYDVHLSLVGAYTEANMDTATFLLNYVQPRHRKYPLQSDQVGYYGVRSSVRLSLLPAQQKITLEMPFPVRPVDIYTLMQYRDLSGENYYQVCCFSAIDETGSYRANVLEPKEGESIDRLHLFDPEDYELPEIPDPWPYYVKDFTDLWNHSLSSRLTMMVPAPPEESPARTVYDF
ncbi:MAG: hypothetical protein AAF921_07220 [Cyanobacteria bacterium P01_D01_bin.44]